MRANSAFASILAAALELAAEETRFIDRAANGYAAEVAVDRHFDLAGRYVCNLAMQAVAKPAVGLEFGSTVALQAATDQQLVKPIDPAEAVGMPCADIRRVDRSTDGRVPAERKNRARRRRLDRRAGRGGRLQCRENRQER